MAGKEVQKTAEWIWDIARADSALATAMGGTVRIAEDGNAQGLAYPYIAFAFVDDLVHSAVGPPTPVYSEGFWTVKVIDESNTFGTAETIWQRMNTLLLTNGPTVVDGVVVGPAQLQGNMRYPEHQANDNRHFQHRGGRYVIDAYEVP